MLTVAPPEQIGQSRPPAGVRASSRRGGMDGHEHAEAPSLRLLRRLRVKIGERVGEVGLGGRNALSTKVGHMWKLIGKHFLHSLLFENTIAGRGRFPIVQERSEDLCFSISQLQNLDFESSRTQVLQGPSKTA